MKCIDRSKDPASRPFETILRGQPLIDLDKLRSGYKLLLYGQPGAGKTTLGFHLLHAAFRKAIENGACPRVFVLSLVEAPEQIARICQLYEFDFRGSAADSNLVVVPGRFTEGQEPDIQKIAHRERVDLKRGDLLLVDGVSMLGLSTQVRATLGSFVDQLKVLGLWAVLIAENYQEAADDFLQYAVDGIIRLGIDERGTRWLQIDKLRWFNQDLSKHAFRLQARSDSADERGIILFPAVPCLINERIAKTEEKGVRRTSSPPREWLPSGVPGFDQQLGRSQGAFRVGERVLLLGPGDTGKFLFGTQFLAAAAEDEGVVCISYVRSVEKVQERLQVLSSIRDRLQGPATTKSKPVCDFLYFDPVSLLPEEMCGAVNNALDKYSDRICRVFIDSISALRILFGSDEQFERFLFSFMRLLETFPNVIVLISYETAKVIESYAEIRVPAEESLSMIVGFNFQEQHNRIVRGITVLKSGVHGDKRDISALDVSALKVAAIKADGVYTIDPQAGWSRVGLLSGQREQVHEEALFFKLFIENRSEEHVLRPFFKNFRERYPEAWTFAMVVRPNPRPSHWSFLGYHGSGHSNTKLVALRKYVMDALDRRDRFMIPPQDVLDSLKDRFNPGFLWEHANSDQSRPSTLPFYADVGVLVYQSAAAEYFPPNANGLPVPRALPVPGTWDDLIEMARTFKPGTFRHLFVIPNAVGDAKSFVSFFFELCWTYGWGFPDRATQGNSETLERLREWVHGKYFDAAIGVLQRMVAAGDGTAIPSPIRGGHYHEAVFTRRWFSKIHLLPDYKASARREIFDFGIAPLPGVEVDGKIRDGVSNVDLYSIGIIREALAPETGWMLAADLLEKRVDVERARLKRGIPIVRKVFRTNEIQDALSTPPIREGHSYTKQQEEAFAKYPKTISAIIDPPETTTQPHFRRTADIFKFADLEELLAEKLPIVIDEPTRLHEIKSAIDEGLQRIYGNGACQ